MNKPEEIEKEKVVAIYVDSLKELRRLTRNGATKTEITSALEKIVTEVVDNED
jgi:hypothetical protein